MPTIDDAVAALRAGKAVSTFEPNRLTRIETVYAHGVKRYDIVQTMAEPRVVSIRLDSAGTPEAAVAALLACAGMGAASIRIKEWWA